MEARFSYVNATKKKSRLDKRRDITKQEAFLEYKHEEQGQQLELSVRDNRNELKNIKTTVKDLTERCNLAKKKIDVVKGDLDKK